MITKEATSNEDKARRACGALREMLSDALRRGYYGTVAVEVSVQDGMIQNFRRRQEQMER